MKEVGLMRSPDDTTVAQRPVERTVDQTKHAQNFAAGSMNLAFPVQGFHKNYDYRMSLTSDVRLTIASPMVYSR
ncbi:hypothetical protein J6590_057491 [Homalodisca vitripennis]|nr:hypothetical protein J6590_057491 [Homalodisca vitripennis]